MGKLGEAWENVGGWAKDQWKKWGQSQRRRETKLRREATYLSRRAEQTKRAKGPKPSLLERRRAAPESDWAEEDRPKPQKDTLQDILDRLVQQQVPVGKEPEPQPQQEAEARPPPRVEEEPRRVEPPAAVGERPVEQPPVAEPPAAVSEPPADQPRVAKPPAVVAELPAEERRPTTDEVAVEARPERREERVIPEVAGLDEERQQDVGQRGDNDTTELLREIKEVLDAQRDLLEEIKDKLPGEAKFG